MATQNGSIAGSGYGNVYLDSLIWGCGWSYSTSPTAITYSFGTGLLSASDSSIGAFVGGIWTDTEKDAFRMALANYSSVCNLQFVESSAATTDLKWWKAPSSAMGDGTLGLHETPDGSFPSIYGYFNQDDPSWAYLNKGAYGYVSIIHELGHAMGLAHPHDGGSDTDATIFPGVTSDSSLGTNEMNQGIWTTMSYNDGWKDHYSGYYDYGWQGTLMALDIAALQKLYGVNTSTATGNDVYRLPNVNDVGSYWSCIWDAGGTDTISNEGSNVACTIDLRAAPLVGVNAGGYVSYGTGIVGGYTIANGVIIETAIGGNGADKLYGNSAGNTLLGGSGNDLIYVGSGTASDRVDGGAGIDGVSYAYAGSGVNVNLGLTTAQATGGSGTDTILNIENLYGSAYGDILRGNTVGNQLYGAAGNDLIYVGSGTASDRVDGGAGIDGVSYAYAGSGVNVNLGLTTAQATGGSGDDIIVNIEKVYGSNFNDVIKGSSVENELYGLSGNDLLYAGVGQSSDKFDGGAGVDGLSYAQSTAAVTVNLAVTTAQNTGGSGVDIIINIENLYGSSYNDVIRDNAATSNNIMGMTGYDLIYAGAGALSDTYDGGVAYDTLSFYYATSAVTISLALDMTQNTVGCGWDKIINIENLHGSLYSDMLSGSSIANNFNGLAGDDQINGFLGNDVLTGGLGKDTFVFNTALNAISNKDTITDFNVFDDTIQLENAIFTKLTALGTLATSYFCANATGIAADSNDFICYNTATGVLSYDADGSGSGASVAFAVLGNSVHPALTAADFVVV